MQAVDTYVTELTTGPAVIMYDLVTGLPMANNPYKPNYSSLGHPHDLEQALGVFQPVHGHVQHWENRVLAHLGHVARVQGHLGHGERAKKS